MIRLFQRLLMIKAGVQMPGTLLDHGKKPVRYCKLKHKKLEFLDGGFKEAKSQR